MLASAVAKPRSSLTDAHHHHDPVLTGHAVRQVFRGNGRQRSASGKGPRSAPTADRVDRPMPLVVLTLDGKG
jgi:hypothetical protein